MRTLELTPPKWHDGQWPGSRLVEYEPPGTCHDFGIGTILSIVGTAASIGGSIAQASAASDAADTEAAARRAQAAELRIKASDEAGAAQRVAISREKQTEVAQSRLRALAAASGGSATDPTVLTLEQQIAEQGGYNALSALYEGQARSRTDELAAEIELFKARRAEAAKPLAAAGTILSGISSFANSRSSRRLFSDSGSRLLDY